MTEEINYFWLNCGYNRWNHNEPLVGQTTLFESGAHFNPSQGFRALKGQSRRSSHLLSSTNRFWFIRYRRNHKCSSRRSK